MKDLTDINTKKPRPGSDLKAFYLSRMQRLIRLRRDFAQELNPLGLRLLDRSLYATLRDCDNAGAGRKARSMMMTLRDASPETGVR